MEDRTDVTLTARQNIVQMIKFTLFSASAGIVEFTSFTLLKEIGRLPYWPCYLIALVLSVVYNFTLNRRFTFKSAANIPIAMFKVSCYYMVFTPLSTWWGDALVKIRWNDYLVLIGTMLINLVTEYLFYRFVVYRGSMYTNDLGRIEMEKERNKSL